MHPIHPPVYVFPLTSFRSSKLISLESEVAHSVFPYTVRARCRYSHDISWRPMKLLSSSVFVYTYKHIDMYVREYVHE